MKEDICDSRFSRIEDAKFLSEVSASYGKSKLWMHNFNEKHPHVIENVECRCKICEESILKYQKGQDADAIYMIGRLKSICKFKEKQVADTLVPKRASATENIKPVQIQRLPQRASATANIKRLQIHQLPKEYLHKRINREYRYISYQKSKSLITLPISITVHHKARKRLCNPANWSRLARRS